MALTWDMCADPDSDIRCHIEVSRNRIWPVLIDRRGPVNGDAAYDETEKEWHIQPMTPAHQNMVSHDHEHAWLYQ